MNSRIIILLFLSIVGTAQKSIDTKLIELDLDKELKILHSNGLDKTDIRYLSVYLTKESNINKQVDTLTLRFFLSNMEKYREDELYKIIQDIPTVMLSRKIFPDSLNVIYNYFAGMESSIFNRKPNLVIFGAIGSANSDFLRNFLIKDAVSLLEGFNVTWLIVDDADDENSNINSIIQKEIFKSDIQPHSFILKDGKIIKNFLGFAMGSNIKYLDFLMNDD